MAKGDSWAGIRAGILGWILGDRFELITMTFVHFSRPFGRTLISASPDGWRLASEEQAPPNPDVPYTAELQRVAAAALSGVRAASIYRDPENDPELSAIAVDTLLLVRRYPEPTHVPWQRVFQGSGIHVRGARA